MVAAAKRFGTPRWGAFHTRAPFGSGVDPRTCGEEKEEQKSELPPNSEGLFEDDEEPDKILLLLERSGEKLQVS